MRSTSCARAVAAILVAASVSVHAADEAAKPAAPTLSDVLTASGLTVSGYVDAAYSHLSGSGAFTSGVTDRVFDSRENSFMLHQAAVTVSRAPDAGFGFVVNVTAGNDSDVIASYDFNGSSKFDITQAYVTYKAGSLTLSAGKFVTLAGSEVIAPTGNTNYSRSILFGYAVPFTHTGVRLNYAANDFFGITLGVNNGWDQVKDTNTSKTAEVGLSFTPSKTISVLVNGYFGKENVLGLTPTGPEGQRTLIDVVATWSATDNLSFGLNYDNGTQEGPTAVLGTTKAKWSGVAGYVNYKFNDQWRISVRAEQMDDKDGYRTGIVQKWKEGTVTVGYAPTTAFELRFEGRYDKSDSKTAFDYTNKAPKDNQNSIAIEALYKF